MFEWIIVIIFRILVPLTILRWPLLGSILAIISDSLDVVILDYLGVRDYSAYNPIDKALDTYIYIIQGYIIWQWKNKLAKMTGIFLLIYRLIGFTLYEITGTRALLFIFPNVFEFYLLYYLAYKNVFKKEPFTKVNGMLITVGILLIPKLYQEYMLHVAQFPIYVWLKDHLLKYLIPGL
jgi:hypothetical protein